MKKLIIIARCLMRTTYRTRRRRKPYNRAKMNEENRRHVEECLQYPGLGNLPIVSAHCSPSYFYVVRRQQDVAVQEAESRKGPLLDAIKRMLSCTAFEDKAYWGKVAREYAYGGKQHYCGKAYRFYFKGDTLIIGKPLNKYDFIAKRTRAYRYRPHESNPIENAFSLESYKVRISANRRN